MRLATILLVALCVTVSSAFHLGTTGKIVGTVTDAKTGEKLMGVNIVVEGTAMGASSDADGYYAILNVPAGTYSLKVTYLGYAQTRVNGVRVEIDQTTTIDIKLSEALINAQEVVVVAERPVVQRDVSSSRANLSARDIENLPISQISSVVGLQAGVQGLEIRGGGSDQTNFVLNGLNMRSERNSTPYTGISLLAVQEVQILTGGFSAEYGNVRSGVVNVVTKEGSPKKYSVGVNVRYSPPQQKYVGIRPNDPNSYWMRPYLDDAVCWTGTDNGAWDTWTQADYKPFAGGWNKVSRDLLSDTDPLNDLSPQAAQSLFLWQHRKNFTITKPDYTVDASLGGPIPGGEMLGNLRFFATFRQQQTMYSIPLSRDAVADYSWDVKLTSDVGNGMKLMLQGLNGRNKAVNSNNGDGNYASFASAGGIASVMNLFAGSYTDGRLFSTDYWSQNQVDRSLYGAKFTHVLTPTTFYEVVAQRWEEKYQTFPGRLRDTARVYDFGGTYWDEAPFGFFPVPGNYSQTGVGTNMRMAIGMANARDTSKLTSYTLKGDFVTQLDRYNQVKAGFEYVKVYNEVAYGSYDAALPSGRSTSKWSSTPQRFEAYVRDKLEFEGMVAEVGVRFSLSQAGGEWYKYDTYTKYFTGPRSFGIDTLLERVEPKTVIAWSPRIGIAFPISENAKFFFNYGHFRQMPTPDNLYMVRRDALSNSVLRISDPNLPFPKTVAYELGYEHNLLDMFLLRVAGYYKDVTDEAFLVTYTGFNNVPNYSVYTNNAYEDIRGFEVTLSKNRGSWVQGFINYTYMVTSSGYFGYSTYKQNPSEMAQLTLSNVLQSKPVPLPYARANIDFFTPVDFGPDWGIIRPLGDWRVNILGTWSSGSYMTWTGPGPADIRYQNNLQWRDNWGLDMRISKSFAIGRVNIQLFMDINNVLDLRTLTSYGYLDAADRNAYFTSLHLPSEFNKFAGYVNIAGDDRPGDYRKDGVAYQPMVGKLDRTGLPADAATNASSSRPFYYIRNEGIYVRWDAGTSGWIQVDKGTIDRMLDDKAYIHTPNQSWNNFLNPRQIFFGLKLSFDLN